VKERIIEAQTLLDEMNQSDPDAAKLAYVQERLVSAKSWSSFFGMKGKSLNIDDIYLQRACLAKLSEADERINYVKLYAPSVLLESERLLAQAQGYSKTEPILCIFTASKAKAQADLLANAMSVDRASVDALVAQKLDAAQVVLQKQQEKGFFPILGYSYAQYAGDLRDANPYSSLTFAEYSIELSNLDIYFPREKHWGIPQSILNGFLIFSFGVIFGASVIFFILRRKPDAPTKRSVKRKKKR
jgi:predicted S18 family serine protease